MASEFITRVEHDKDEPYTVIFRTDDADKYKYIEDECRRMIGHEMPTVDAVPVVRCKDCAYWDRGTIRMIAGNPELIGAICDKYHENGISEDVWTAADHFCADGESNEKSSNE